MEPNKKTPVDRLMFSVRVLLVILLPALLFILAGVLILF